MKSRILLTLLLAAAMVVPATAQFGTIAQAPIIGTACNYSPTLGIDLSTGEIFGCGTNHVWAGFSAASAQTLTNKTLVAPVISGGLTASGSAANDFSASTGAFKTSTGANTFGGATTIPVTASLTLGTAGSAVGQSIFNNATSGSVTLQPVTGALGSAVLSLPAATDTLVGKATTDTFSGKSFNQNVLPLNAGAVDVGQASLPFLHLWLGTAATNNFEFIPAATAAARTVAINDQGANSTLRLEITGSATVDLASVASGACSADSSDVTVTGAAVGDDIAVTAGTALQAGSYLVGRVTASSTARFQFCNLSGGAIDRASDTYTLRVKR